ncbi:aldolase [Cohnella lubricantis]|uniref:Aldolase n=2 Tax=Cohnella lubricantis TaxID=2163172 RepID=A0A841T5L5_9BACL|nr:aldolase [Cohnella lubricantis]MBB6676823.1 aldolase [Cohnella lubricantis]
MYIAFGLAIASDIPLPELLPYTGGGDPDLTIELADVQGEIREGKYEAERDRVRFRVPNAAAFCVERGTRILVAPDAGADRGEIRQYLLGTCMGAALLQRNILPLHGSAIVIGGKAYAFVGDSGAGKSTLASIFVSRGCSLLSDDVIAVTLDPREGLPYVVPSYPQQKLWQESLDHLGMDAERYRPLIGRETKFAIPVSGYCSEPLPLAGLYELRKEERGDVRLERIPRLEKLATAFLHTFRRNLLYRSGLLEWHFSTTAAIVSCMDMHRIVRPLSGFTGNDLASLVLSTIQEEDVKEDERPEADHRPAGRSG